jgi:hypothetical protein
MIFGTTTVWFSRSGEIPAPARRSLPAFAGLTA